MLLVQELDHVVEELEKIAKVNLLQHRSIISLIGNVQRSSLVLEKVLFIISLHALDAYSSSKVCIIMVLRVLGCWCRRFVCFG